MIKGLFIEDDIRDFQSYKDAFRVNDIELIDMPVFPERIDAIYQIISSLNMDFIIIDNHLDKKTSQYNGIDILAEIRSNDPEIHIVYLTSKDFDATKLNKFDQAVKKENFSKEKLIVIERIQRAVSRDVSIKLEREIEDAAKRQQDYFDKQLAMLAETLTSVKGNK